MLLDVKNIAIHYGAIQAVKDMSFTVEEGEIVTLIGANGAGKSSALHAISGMLRPSAGDILFQNESILKQQAYKIVQKGISQVPEGRRIFANLTVLENLKMGAYINKNKSQVRQDIERTFDRFPRLEERKDYRAGTLSGGEQQMLAIARALMAHPKLLLLDEPSMGLSPILVQEIFRIIRDINEDGVSILLVEQNAQLALAIANRAYVLETGKILYEGEAKSLLLDDRIKQAYLGG